MRTSDPSVALAMVEVAARALDETDPDEATDLELAMQLRVLWRGIGRLRAQFTRRLVVRARQEAQAAVRRLASRLRQRVDPARTVVRQRRAYDSRWLTLERTGEGAVAVRGLLDPVGGETLASTVDRHMDRSPDGRTPAQRRADALVAALYCPRPADV